ncbi:hypothetical protein TUM12370_03430 [Salmonella enterica subsp. enterica serovar Choleraesuis]|nr:hypothetical protein TUM12370_03430 [Salmonella enterica subsp. enterica serovar Choleraesuis]
MASKLTDKQKERLWAQTRSPNFKASSRLEDIEVEVITLDEKEISERIAALRSHYER